MEKLIATSRDASKPKLILVTSRTYQEIMVEREQVVISSPRKEAGGWQSISYSAKHIFREVGVVEGSKALLRVNQYKGFDCPGCAWPDPDDHRSAVEFCENGAKAIAEEATTERVDADFFKRHSVASLQQWSDYQIGKSGRITEPFLLEKGATHYKQISWSEAFGKIGDKLKSLSSPHEAVFYTSGRTSNEAAFLYQLFVRMYGTNNLPDCSNMCHESSGVALTETVGIGKGSVKLDDFYQAELIIISGQNPGTNHPRMLTALQKAKANGAKIITINPMPEAGLIAFRHPQHPTELIGPASAITDLWLQVKVNEDVALLKAILKLLWVKERQQPGTVFDREFIEAKTTGHQQLLDDLQLYDTRALIERSGVAEEKVLEAVEMIATKKKIIASWAMGLTQHKNAVDNIRELVNLLLLKGSIGKPGAGTCPVRGHSNVQGDRTMGIYEKPKREFLDSLEKNFEFEPPRNPGYDTVEAIGAMLQKKVKVFFAMGGNFLSASPDTKLTATALNNCELTVQVSTKLNRSHLTPGTEALILPCLGRTDYDVQSGVKQFVTVENSTGVVHQSSGGKTPISKSLMSEVRIVAELAKSTLESSQVNWDKLANNYDLIRDLIERTIPGFENYNARVRIDGGFYLPNAAREGDFTTHTQKANFTINELPTHVLKSDEFLMMTVRSHDQYNTTIYGLDDRYRGIRYGRRVVFMNEADMVTFGLTQGTLVDLLSTYDGIERVAENFTVVPYDIPAQNLATYFPEANAVIPYNHFAKGSQTPISKSVIVRLRKKEE